MGLDFGRLLRGRYLLWLEEDGSNVLESKLILVVVLGVDERGRGSEGKSALFPDAKEQHMDPQFQTGGQSAVNKSFYRSVIEPGHLFPIICKQFTHNNTLIIKTAAFINGRVEVMREFFNIVGSGRLAVPYDSDFGYVKKM